MLSETFLSAGENYKMTVYPAPSDGKKYPVIVIVHGNYGLGEPYGAQIHGLAKDLASQGYMTAVPQYYLDDYPHLEDTEPHVTTLTDAIAKAVDRPEADPDRLGLIGFSLGAATSMMFIASNPKGTIKVLADFFGFLTPTIRGGVSKFPPTIIFHNKHDLIVDVQNSKEFIGILPGTDHEFVEYEERWLQVNHAFRPGGEADDDSRQKTSDWISKHV